MPLRRLKLSPGDGDSVRRAACCGGLSCCARDASRRVALAVVHAYKVSLVDPDCSGNGANNSTGSMNMTRRAGSDSANSTACSRRGAATADLTTFGPVWPPSFDLFKLGDNIGIALSTLALVCFIHWILKKFVLMPLFRFLCTEGELLFFGVMAYSLGSCALCIQADFSPVSSAYIAGFAISYLPSRIQVLQKIASLRAFGLFIFAFMLGIYCKIDPNFFENYFPWALLITAVIVIVNPIFMFILGHIFDVRSRTVIYMSLLCNNVGEHALILASLAYQAGIFKFEILQTFVSFLKLSTYLIHECIRAHVQDACSQTKYTHRYVHSLTASCA